MRIFAQKPKATQQTTSAKSTIPGRVQFGQSRDVSSILHLQRTIGNQAVQRLLEANTQDVKGDSTTEIARFGHDFSRIPLHSIARAGIQPKLTISTPGDIYEQEADQVADQVMRMPDPIRSTEQASMKVLTPFRPAVATIMRQPTPRGTEEEMDLEKQRTMLKLVCPDCEDLLQAKEASSEGIRVSTGFESQIKNLQYGGQPLSNSVRESLEPKFGYDFSNVRIHTEAQAGDTARRMNALAFTIGPHIVFAPGQFAPHSYQGKKLLAHELTHVVQQSPVSKFATNQDGFFKSHSPIQSGGSRIGIHMQAAPGNIFRHTSADCDRWYEQCCDGCRSMPNRTKADKARRALCWARCATEYGACLASSEEALVGALTGLAIAGAVALAAADGPFPFGDAAAVGLLSLVGISL